MSSNQLITHAMLACWRRIEAARPVLSVSSFSQFFWWFLQYLVLDHWLRLVMLRLVSVRLPFSGVCRRGIIGSESSWWRVSCWLVCGWCLLISEKSVTDHYYCRPTCRLLLLAPLATNGRLLDMSTIDRVVYWCIAYTCRRPHSPGRLLYRGPGWP